MPQATTQTQHARSAPLRERLFSEGAVLLVAAVIFLGTIVSPPSLMDDVDAAYAQVARTMLESGDWVTARLNGIIYLDKAPLQVWAMAASYALFGVHDWAARLPMALAAVALCWLALRFGGWAFSPRAGLFAGLSLATCVGLFLFTRVRIPDVALTLAVTLALWSFLRALEPGEPRPRRWAALMAASLAVGMLAKGLVGVILPAGAAALYLLLAKQLFSKRTWQRLHVVSGLAIFLVIAAPWHLLATLRNPPYFDFTLNSGPGEYRGFFWRYFINEHLLRYLGLRYPRDYNTVPFAQYWLLHLVWLFPWSVFFPAAARLSYRAESRAGRARLLALCWAAFVLLFFSFSTSQEYYTLPAYPALALLVGSAIAEGGSWVRGGIKAVAALATLGGAAAAGLLFWVRGLPTPGDISAALAQNPEAYTLALGHLGDLTLAAFAYLRLPLALAAFALLAGAVAAWSLPPRRSLLAIAAMMVLFLHAAHLAMARFDPYLSSKPLAVVLEQSPPGTLIVDREYYAFSSIMFYANRGALLLNGRKNQVEYGSHAPGAPDVFLTDESFERLWKSTQPYYLATFQEELPRFERLVGRERLHRLAESGGKLLVANQPPASPSAQHVETSRPGPPLTRATPSGYNSGSLAAGGGSPDVPFGDCHLFSRWRRIRDLAKILGAKKG